jgi:capsid protein
MNLSAALAVTTMLLGGWVVTYPESALDIISTLRRQFRRSVIERTGNQVVEELAQKLKAEARRMNIPQAVAEEVIEECKEEIIESLGNQYARDLLDD